MAEAPPDARIALDAEHDRFAYSRSKRSLLRCLPAIVARALTFADEWVERGGDRRR